MRTNRRQRTAKFMKSDAGTVPGALRLEDLSPDILVSPLSVPTSACPVLALPYAVFNGMIRGWP
jgi:hypothetical protein